MDISITELQFDEHGLIPAIVQDIRTGKVLTLAYMNKESLQKTIETKETWFFSRKRKKLWNKGETSGNKQKVRKIAYDCDGDALLVYVSPLGPACHTGEETCFYQSLYAKEEPVHDIIYQVVDIIKNRRQHPTEGSYTAYLFEKGVDKILKKVGEETSEVIIGAKNADKQELTSEIADLTYHVLVLMEHAGVTLDDIKAELKRRHMEKEGQEKDA